MELENAVTNTDQAIESQFQFDTSNDGYLGDVITLAGYHILSKEQNYHPALKIKRSINFQDFPQQLNPFMINNFIVNMFMLLSNSAATATNVYINYKDYSFTQQKEFFPTNLSSLPPQGETHEAAIKNDPVPRNHASEGGQGKKISYPFKWLKSRGVEGETTLNDSNNQILTTPSTSKQIPRHVKDYETHPYKLAHGLTGKAVTSLTRIRTRGRGSITIIRTKD